MGRALSRLSLLHLSPDIKERLYERLLVRILLAGSVKHESSGALLDERLPSMTDLGRIASKYDTDKAVHTHYLKNYEHYFQPLRNEEIRLLELGIKHGGSLLLWRDYFSEGTIVGLDINPVTLDDESGRVRTYQGGQQDTELLDRIARETAPEGFDIIIDDCSHIGVLSRVSFWHLFDNHLKSGGVYVVEDWGTGYWESWVDGVAYRPHTKGYRRSIYQFVRVLARLQRSKATAYLPFAKALLARAKAMALKRDSYSHDFGMVGFIKELIDELGMADITDLDFGNAPHRKSKFREMRMSPSHLFVIKS